MCAFMVILRQKRKGKTKKKRGKQNGKSKNE